MEHTYSPSIFDMDKIVSLCKRRGFIFPSSDIYGGLGSTWDYGPLGVELKRNVRDAWWRAVVQQRDNAVTIRHRDTMQQTRVPIPNLVDALREQLTTPSFNCERE